ncbi:hypothetical protein EDD86DRAFT_96368 [Gorgonomyces haynaldii]|nr:hypothetical protein EDD86DRAFT_96368 [Gorgonomyces haynaldii]
MRELKFHEKKLLSKVNFVKYKKDSTLRENTVMRKYHVQKRQDYYQYDQLCGQIRKAAHELSLLDPKDPFRSKKTELFLDKLYKMGLINSEKALVQCEKMSVSAFCRRRLAVVMNRLKMAETVQMAVRYIEQGHVRVGPNVVKDPAFLVTRNMEDYVSWTDASKIKRKILKYNDELDDFDLL